MSTEPDPLPSPERAGPREDALRADAPDPLAPVRPAPEDEPPPPATGPDTDAIADAHAPETAPDPELESPFESPLDLRALSLPEPGIGAAIGLLLVVGFLSFLTAIPCYAAVRALLPALPKDAGMLVAGTAGVFVVCCFFVRHNSGPETRRHLAVRSPAPPHLLLVALLSPPLFLLSGEVVNCAALALGVEPFPPAAPQGILMTAALTPSEWQAKAERELAQQSWWLVLLAGCVLPALGEEAFFRGFLGRGLVARLGPVLGVLLTSVLFGLAHVEPLRVCATTVLGVALHLVFLATRSFWAPVLLHAVHNGLVFTSFRLAEDAHLDITGQYGSRHVPAVSLAAAAAALGVLGFALYRTRTSWALPEGRDWDPGFVTAETPPARLGAAPRRGRLAPPAVVVTAAFCIAFTLVALVRADPSVPRDAWGYNERGNDHLERGELDQALAAYNEAVRLDPKYAYAYANRGIVLTRKGEHERAVAEFDRALELMPGLEDVYLNRGQAYANLGNFDRAVADYDEAIRRKPSDALAYASRGVAHLRRKQPDLALADLNEALAREKLAETYVFRGEAYLAKGQHGFAIQDLTEAIRLEPGNARAYFVRGEAYQAWGDQARADADFREGARLDPGPGR